MWSQMSAHTVRTPYQLIWGAKSYVVGLTQIPRASGENGIMESLRKRPEVFGLPKLVLAGIK